MNQQEMMQIKFIYWRWNIFRKLLSHYCSQKMSKKKKKYYTVWKGHHPGVFESWDDCKAQIKDFQGAQYKSFSTFEAAKKAYKGNYKDYVGKNKAFKSELSEAQLKKIGQPNLNSISVDAASSGNPGKMEYRGVDTQTKKQIFI